MEGNLRVVPIHRSLTRPLLVMGCERFLFLMLGMVSTLLGFSGISGSNLPNLIAGFVVFFAGRELLVHMAKKDPCMSDIFRRNFRYRAEYPACSTVGCHDVPTAKRW